MPRERWFRRYYSRIYWTLGDLPGLNPVEPRQRLSVYLRYSWRAFSHWRFWVAIAGPTILGGFLGVWVGRCFFNVPDLRADPLIAQLPWAIGASIPGAFAGNYWSAYINEMILADHPELCSGCGYNLSGSKGRCPECGSGAGE